MTDANEIIHALRLWFQAGDVFEVRVLDAVSADYRREHIESGYFDYEHISAVPEALKRLLSFRGVYVTVNPVNPDLLARAVNRLRPAGRNPTTADTDIVRRRWLLIDCDPRRASGVSSSNAEHESALANSIGKTPGNTADSVVRWFHTSDDETGNQKNQWASPCGHPRPRGRTAEADLASAGYSQRPEMAGNADERRGKEFDGSGITAWTQAFLCLKNSFFEQSCS
mgnify:CR=1 FL=1